MADLRWWTESSPIGALTVSVSDAGLQRIELDGSAPEIALEERDGEIGDQLAAYFAGELKVFTVPLDLSTVKGPAARAILETLAGSVPFGLTIGYGELATRAGHPGAARAVGQAMARNPVPIVIPCHRVVGSGGVLGGFGWGLDAKRWLLSHEGVVWV